MENSLWRSESFKNSLFSDYCLCICDTKIRDTFTIFDCVIFSVIRVKLKKFQKILIDHLDANLWEAKLNLSFTDKRLIRGVIISVLL